MSKQQTAVEWLIEQLRQLAHNPSTHLGMGDIRVTQGMLDDFEEQAKELEKQQHEKTWFDSTMQFANESEMINKKYFDDYYTETFNQ